MKRKIERVAFPSVFYMLYMIFSFFPGGLENRNRLMHGGISYVHIYGIVTSLIQIFLSHVREYFKDGIIFGCTLLDCNVLKIANLSF